MRNSNDYYDLIHYLGRESESPLGLDSGTETSAPAVVFVSLLTFLIGSCRKILLIITELAIKTTTSPAAQDFDDQYKIVSYYFFIILANYRLLDNLCDILILSSRK